LSSEHGCHGGTLSFVPQEETLAETLAAVGYDTYAVSNNVWVSDHFGFDRDFETFYKQWQLFREARDLGHLLKSDRDLREVVNELLSGNVAVNLLNSHSSLAKRHPRP
jgi:arylsulfatase A-like enzyme